MGLHVAERGSILWPEKLQTNAEHFEAFKRYGKAQEKMEVSNIYSTSSVVPLTLHGCHVSPGRWLHSLLGK